MSTNLIKTCIKCKNELSVDAFGKDARRKDGLFPYCKRCRLRDPQKSDEWAVMQAQGLKRCSTCKQWLSSSRFYSNRYHKDGLHTHCRVCSLAQVKRYSEANHLKVIARDKAYRDANPERRAGFFKRWYEANTDRQILRANEQRGYRASQPNTLTGDEWRQIIFEQGNSCAKCRRRFTKDQPPTRDHIVPASQGGALTAENCQALCRGCNTSKGTKTVDYRAFGL